MNLQVFLEWFHRLIASTIGLLTAGFLGMALWYRHALPKWLPWAAGWSFFLVVFQGILGGLTVTELLRFDIVTAHLGTGLLFFSTLIAIAIALLPYRSCATAGKLPWVGGTAAALVYGQCLLGGLVASRWAAHQCLAGSELCNVLNSHFIGVVPASVSTLVLTFMAWRTPVLHPLLRKLAYLATVFLLMQVAIGVGTYMLHLQVEPLTVMHQAVGAALLGTLVAFTALAIRDRHQQQSLGLTQ